MSNGCGCETGILRYIKAPYAKMFYVPCCIHDNDYDSGGKAKERKKADVTLYRNMCKVIGRTDCTPFKAHFLTGIALLYYISVRIFGRFYFKYDRKKITS
ncbi:MAG: group XII secretory phospholipase A2 precursor (PLA2G12) [Bacteriophage sp.]|nr:MAG: group XII secretory phospholipase A2 precursor (PLA2G12) [Bacteriophage sp.]